MTKENTRTEEKSTDGCLKCGEKADVFLGPPDPDLKGIPACNSCKDEIRQDLLLATLEPDEFEKWFFDKYNIK